MVPGKVSLTGCGNVSTSGLPPQEYSKYSFPQLDCMEKEITVRGHFRKVAGRARRVRIPAFTKTVNRKSPSESNLETMQELHEEPEPVKTISMLMSKPISSLTPEEREWITNVSLMRRTIVNKNSPGANEL